MPARRRVDAELVRRGLSPSRAEARAAIEGGLVTVAGRPATKASTMVATDEPLHVSGPGRPFVSRGGEKLAPALDRFAVQPAGRDALDAGASTGGFTDVLLRRGAARVVAVDVGYGQLAWSLREDPRVTVLERTNVRDLQVSMLPFVPSLVVADLSFMSLRLALPAFARVAPGAELVLLVKPQFEAGPADVGSGGVVRDPSVWERALRAVADAADAVGFGARAVMASPLLGPAGNVEFLLHAGPGSEGLTDEAIAAALAEGAGLRAEAAS
jgi:23S rRNA (cytidine1920-2'-O)/16S rRNA (cytidine1409-2'-O)-methyltransferase